MSMEVKHRALKSGMMAVGKQFVTARISVNLFSIFHNLRFCLDWVLIFIDAVQYNL